MVCNGVYPLVVLLSLYVGRLNSVCFNFERLDQLNPSGVNLTSNTGTTTLCFALPTKWQWRLQALLMMFLSESVMYPTYIALAYDIDVYIFGLDMARNTRAAREAVFLFLGLENCTYKLLRSQAAEKARKPVLLCFKIDRVCRWWVRRALLGSCSIEEES